MRHALPVLAVLGSFLVQGFDWNTLGLGGSEEEHGTELRRHRAAEVQRGERAVEAQEHVDRQVRQARGADLDSHALQEQARWDVHQQAQQGYHSVSGQRASLSVHSTEFQHRHQRQSQNLRGSTVRTGQQSGAPVNIGSTRVTTLDGPQDGRSVTLRLHQGGRKKKNNRTSSHSSEPQVVIHSAGWVPPHSGGASITSPAAGVLFINTQPPQRVPHDNPATEDDYIEITP